MAPSPAALDALPVFLERGLREGHESPAQPTSGENGNDDTGNGRNGTPRPGRTPDGRDGNYGHQVRHRRSAERRQVDALQCADAGADRSGGELSVLHDRSERRRRAGAGSAAGPARRHRPIRERILPTTVEFVDIAGLVAGASKGEGLGNKFLSHIRETDAIAHVVRCFENDDIVHVAGTHQPAARHRGHQHRARARRSRHGRARAACAPRRPRRPATRMRSGCATC